MTYQYRSVSVVNARELVKAREQAGYTIEQVADILDIPADMIGKFENGDTLPYTDELNNMASLYRIPTHMLIWRMA